MNPDWTRELVTINEACARTGVSRRTIYNWMKAGKLQTLKTTGGSTRIYADTLFKEGGDRHGQEGTDAQSTETA